MTEAARTAPYPTHRLIPSRFPPINRFETVTSPEDAAAAMELEGWTNDRLVSERLARLPQGQWVYGTPNASVITAAFLHPPPTGSRFNGPELGAWYVAAALPTAIAELAHHLRREAVARNQIEARRTYRAYTARPMGADYVDLRGLRARLPEVYAPDSYVASQVVGKQARGAGRSGIVYDSVRHTGGINVVAVQPLQVTEVTQAGHYDLIVPVHGRVVARQILNPT